MDPELEGAAPAFAEASARHAVSAIVRLDIQIQSQTILQETAEEAENMREEDFSAGGRERERVDMGSVSSVSSALPLGTKAGFLHPEKKAPLHETPQKTLHAARQRL